VAGSGVGKTTGLPPTVTAAFFGEPRVIEETPVSWSDSLAPFLTVPCHSRVEFGPITNFAHDGPSDPLTDTWYFEAGTS